MTRRPPGLRRFAAVSAAAVAVTAALGTLLLAACMPLPRTIETLPKPDLDFSDFTEQVPQWVACADGMQCADVFAPLDWADPEGERITLRLVKHPAENGSPLGTVFVNPGGPGASGADYIASYIDGAVGAPVRENYDVIGWDPRGVGDSSAVSCFDDAEFDQILYGLNESDTLEEGTDAWLEAASRESAEFGEACLENTGALLEFVDTASTVQDLDMLRALVGDAQLNYLGYSYGTYIGARYADAYPERVGRLVLDGALDPTSTESEVVREQTIGFEDSLRSYVTDCLTREECPVTGPIDAAMAQWGALLDAVDAEPLRGSDGRWVTSSTLLTAIITPLYAQGSWPWLDELYATAANGDGDTALYLADFYNDRVDGVYQTNLMEAFSAINCLDYPSSGEIDLDQLRAEAAELDAIAPTIGRFQGFGGVFCANWPFTGVETREPVSASGAEPILVVGTTGDPATPYRWAVSLAEQLESGVLVTYEGEGHTAYGENACIDAIVDGYFLTGAVPSKDATVCS